MATPSNKRRAPNALYQAAVYELADERGWRQKDIWFHFQQLAWHVEFDRKWPRACAEWFSLQLVRAVFTPTGERPS